MRLYLAEELLAAGRSAEASRELGTALGFYSSVGASAFVWVAEALLPAAG